MGSFLFFVGMATRRSDLKMWDDPEEA